MTQGKIQTAYHPALPEAAALDTRIALIRALIPLGLQAVEEVLQQEVAALAGPRSRGETVPRVRNRQAGVEMPLRSYTRLKTLRAADPRGPAGGARRQ